jgi:transposase InsO family protein
MSKARLVITAVVHEQRPVSEVAAAYGMHRSWIYRLLARYRAEGEAAYQPRSRRPKTSPNATDPATVELALKLRSQLTTQGLDAGAHTISWHLREHHGIRVSPATIWRHLHKAGRITPQPQKRPRSSYLRFEADLPNQLWQTDFTHVRLADGTDVEVLSFIDDHSRYALSVTAHRPVTGKAVVAAFDAAIATHGTPAGVLSDNGMVFTARFAGGRGGRNKFEHRLQQLGVTQKHSRPNHPTTCGKVERFQQTLKNWLARQPPPANIEQLQALLDQFVAAYNTARPHRALAGRTPHAAYQARPKATPTGLTESHYRIRRDTVDATGVVTVRHAGRLHHIGLGRTHARTRVLMLIDDLHIRVTHATTGALIRELTLDPSRDYQPSKIKRAEPVGSARRR